MSVRHLANKIYDYDSYVAHEKNWRRAVCGDWHWRSPELRDECCDSGVTANLSLEMWRSLRVSYPTATDENMTDDPAEITCLFCLDQQARKL
jgi:hypothetical protein